MVNIFSQTSPEILRPAFLKLKKKRFFRGKVFDLVEESVGGLVHGLALWYALHNDVLRPGVRLSAQRIKRVSLSA